MNRRFSLTLTRIAVALGLLLTVPAIYAEIPFIVHVTDDLTGRGVPLVELRTLSEVPFVTDSAGIAAIDDTTLNGHTVFFRVSSHGYEFAAKVLDKPGLMLKVTPGVRAELKVHRLNIAERLYRITGAGIYRDSVLAGLPVPIEQPLLNGGVTGQDTVSAAIYRGRIFWIWGDTLGLANFNFAVGGATSELPEHGGLDPSVGINLDYFTNRDGFSKAMLPLPRKGMVWIEGLFTVRDPKGAERLLATYTRQQGLTPADECGVAIFNDERKVFEPWLDRPCFGGHVPAHPFLHREGGHEYWYLYALHRVPNDWAAIQDPKQWESFVQDRDGHWAWIAGAARPDHRDRKRFALIDIATGKPSWATPSCVVWNSYRKRWILLSEHFGDVYYSEADRPEGPWNKGVVIVHHTRYNFYNVATHPFFNQHDGRLIYLEGTYTTSFTDARETTPRYNYNQVMYRLDLDDPRLDVAR
jgi:hypothetical protein